MFNIVNREKLIFSSDREWQLSNGLIKPKKKKMYNPAEGLLLPHPKGIDGIDSRNFLIGRTGGLDGGAPSEEVLAEYLVTRNAGVTLNAAGDLQRYWIQGFKITQGVNMVVTKSSFRVANYGSFTGQCWNEVWSAKTTGSTHNMGTASSTVDQSTLPTHPSYAEPEVTYAAEDITLVPATQYYFIITGNTATSSTNNFLIDVDQTSPTYADGFVSRMSLDTNTVGDFTTWDHWFQIKGKAA